MVQHHITHVGGTYWFLPGRIEVTGEERKKILEWTSVFLRAFLG